jgi:hypothetical protein
LISFAFSVWIFVDDWGLTLSAARFDRIRFAFVQLGIE